ncbi:Type I phosphodiesterase / nucleotide pyrophosphatase [Aquisphaera giovannonii]|uniref:Type I phosphodiesterase / nucleotide pyrophosphatase n=1 Tax=Aquisphaera giovannonii TaxID=406548 RepID=A0A5B9W9W6_9BACT|nr:alkaline phosphatase family protein [Aquisphaera giovannonii]QEH36640.1 Type I phosphodiesterase / nucleotide pyrophosphatase [Aquisphaera giovannonii]
MRKPIERLLVLGLDGATWTVLDPMRRRGLMPNLDALLKDAAHGTLRSIIPPVTTAAWTTMMTGCNPPRHGVFDHRYYDAAAGRMKVNHSGRVRVPTVWKLLSDAGRSVVSLNVPGLYPPPKLRGVVVSGMDAPHLNGALQSCPEFGAKLKAEAPNYTLRYPWKHAPKTLEELRENGRATVETFLGRAQGGLLADGHVPDWSVLMVQFQNLDPFQHRVWRYLNVDETGIDDPAWNDAAGEVIRGLDRAIGTLCELADRRGAAVMVVSDHGFGPCLGRIDVNGILVDAGVARLPGAVGSLRRRMKQARDHLRVWIAKRHDPSARSASFDQSISSQFPFDWKRTLAFAPHQDTAAMIYVNSPSRRGTSRDTAPLFTPRQIDDACGAAEEALAAAVHPETGRRLFPRIIRMAEAYDLDPAREGYPDLIAMPDEPYWVRTRFTGAAARVTADPNLPGTHRPEGIVALAGVGLSPGRTLNANLIDATPTILDLLGMPAPDHVEGRSIVSDIAPATIPSPSPEVREHPAESLIDGPHRGGFEYTDEEQSILEQRLADLGYLE